MKKNLRLNEWISVSNPLFEYKMYWPYKLEKFNPSCESIDVYCKLNGVRDSIGTFMTIDKISEMMARFRKTNENGGLFVPMGSELIVERLSNDVVEKSIASLLKDGIFDDYFC